MGPRNSQRVLLRIHVQVRWKPEGQEPIIEDTNTLVVNAHGALIALAMRVRAGSQLLLHNWGTATNQECRVVHVRPMPDGKNEVGIAFLAPNPKFWGLDFPPEDWKPFFEEGAA
jgi:hypothetical protein